MEEVDVASGTVLERLDGVIPWERLKERIRRPCYAKAGRGRWPCPLSVVLRVLRVRL